MLKTRLALLATVLLVAAIALGQLFGPRYGAAQPGVGNVTLLPGGGVSFKQIDFTWPGSTALMSDTGQMDVDIAALEASTGVSSGFLNVRTELGWIVQNLRVPPQFPYPVISTKVEISNASGVDITSLDASVSLSSKPLESPPAGPLAAFSVGDIQFNAQGKESPVTGGPPSPPGLSGHASTPAAARDCSQPNHPNVQAANGQCGPAAVANSLRWLETTYDIAVPHDNIPGVRGTPANSLVGQLDLTMGRTARSRTDGDNTSDLDVVQGKLEYVADNGLGGQLSVKHQDDDFGEQDVSASGLISEGRGSATVSFIIDEVCKGGDVAIGYSYPGGGGHWVELVGAGTTASGAHYVYYRSDHLQTDEDPNDTRGTGDTDYSEIRDTDGDTLPNLVNEGGVEVDIVLVASPSTAVPAQSPTPTPTATRTPTTTPTRTPTPSPPLGATRTVNLSPAGWHDLAWSGSDDTDPGTAMACLSGKYSIAYAWEGPASGFKRYVAGCPVPGICNMAPLKGYDSMLVLTSGEATCQMPVAASAPVADRTVNLSPAGWHDLAWSGVDGTDPGAAMACLSGKYSIAYAWEGPMSGFKRYVPGCTMPGICNMSSLKRYDSMLVLTSGDVTCQMPTGAAATATPTATPTKTATPTPVATLTPTPTPTPTPTSTPVVCPESGEYWGLTLGGGDFGLDVEDCGISRVWSVTEWVPCTEELDATPGMVEIFYDPPLPIVNGEFSGQGSESGIGPEESLWYTRMVFSGWFPSDEEARGDIDIDIEITDFPGYDTIYCDSGPLSWRAYLE